MELETFILKFENLYNRFLNLSRQGICSKSDGLIIGSLGAILAVSIGLFPKWVSYVSLAALLGEGYAVYQKACKRKNEQYALIQEFADCLKQLSSYCADFRNQASKIKEQIDATAKVEDDTIKEDSTNARSERQEDSSFVDSFETLLVSFQRLEHASHAFGEKAASYVSKELEDALDQCGLEFVEYSDDTKKLYYVEYANVSEPKYALKAISSAETNLEGIKVFGRIFLPKVDE